jgi:hypothetical protein
MIQFTSAELECVLKRSFVVKREGIRETIVTDRPSLLFRQKIKRYDFIDELTFLEIKDHGHDRLDPH